MSGKVISSLSVGLFGDVSHFAKAFGKLATESPTLAINPRKLLPDNPFCLKGKPSSFAGLDRSLREIRDSFRNAIDDANSQLYDSFRKMLDDSNRQHQEIINRMRNPPMHSFLLAFEKLAVQPKFAT